jgi:CheY-like chemotaxis protein
MRLDTHPRAKSQANLSPILIVDDRPENLWFLEDVLNDAGFTNCRTTTNARNVADIWAEFQPALVLLDLHMPEVDGITVMKAIFKCLAGDQYLPVAILTSDASTEARDGAFAAGAADFLIKPFSPADFVSLVRRLLKTNPMFQTETGMSKLDVPEPACALESEA